MLYVATYAFNGLKIAKALQIQDNPLVINKGAQKHCWNNLGWIS